MQTKSISSKSPAAGRGCDRAVMANCGPSTGLTDGTTHTTPTSVMGGMDGPPSCKRRAHASN
eukprot:9129119-Lingulodinium_polyedra.AAC.1